MLCLARAHVPTAPSFARRASSSRAPSASRAEQQSRAQSSGSSTNANNNTVTYYNLLDRVADKHPELSKAQLKRVVDSTVAALRDSVRFPSAFSRLQFSKEFFEYISFRFSAPAGGGGVQREHQEVRHVQVP